ncbi:hypothetical protein ACTWJ8_08290 [Streptomyces sp. SDT5-1]|uniref:hypothetical protein n=1 Tax=Streptomyces sp. SDT5-1 TaxID=3406418 RepID=UPI003FD527C9
MAQQREQAADDAMMSRIGQAVMLHHGGDREEAQGRFLGLWAEIGEDGDALHRCTLAHYMADTQDDPSDELAWDLRALSAADSLTQERLSAHESSLALRAFYPSLHLNLAADYVKLDRPDAARSHLARARAAAGSLADDGYGEGVRAALSRLEERVAAMGAGSGEPGEGDGGHSGGEPLGPPRSGS